MVLALSMSGSAILRPVSTIGDEDGAAIASPRASGWAVRESQIVSPHWQEERWKSTEIKMTESEA